MSSPSVTDQTGTPPTVRPSQPTEPEVSEIIAAVRGASPTPASSSAAASGRHQHAAALDDDADADDASSSYYWMRRPWPHSTLHRRSVSEPPRDRCCCA